MGGAGLPEAAALAGQGADPGLRAVRRGLVTAGVSPARFEVQKVLMEASPSAF